MYRFLLSLVLCVEVPAAETADWIISAGHVITMDPERRVIAGGAVAVRGRTIAGVGTLAEINKQFTARQRINRPEAILAPGLVNTHNHAPMSLFRGIADDMRLQDWLEKFIFPAEAKNVTAEFCRWGTRLAVLEMLLSGTTTYTDMYYFEDVIAEETRNAGMRGVLGETVIGFPVPDAKTPAAALAFAENYIQRFAKDALITPAIAPHAVYTVPADVLKQARALANKYGVPLLIHLSETKRENVEAEAKHRMSPTRLLDSLGILNGRTLGAHGVWLDDADLDILRKRGTGIAHCPSSNMKLASGAAPVVKQLRAGLNVGLGTDGPAGSNNDFSLFEEMDLAAKLQKVSLLDPQALPAKDALAMATIYGARALGMGDRIGSLEKGKLADLIVVRTDQPHALPMYDPYSQMVYALKGSDVRDVMINGRLVVSSGMPLTLQPGPILAKAKEYHQKILASLRN
ncbi:MAG: amidohydrolase [Acidobacteria bacterium]|nr:amidohydrolase [Acidobacteriota bacterium]